MVKRNRPPTITKAAVNFGVPHGGTAKAQQAWKYAGNRVERAPTVLLDPDSADPYTDPKPGNEGLPRRKQESNFLITVNSNIAASSDGQQEALEKQMKATMQYLQKRGSIAKYLKFGPVDNKHYGKDKFKAVIHSVDWKADVETGPLNGRVHGHAWLTITHYSQIQIDSKLMQHLARAAFNGSTVPNATQWKRLPYVHVKRLPQSNWTEVMRQYIHKAMKTE